MKTISKWMLIALAASLLAACQDKGPMEELGEDVDEAAEEAQQAVDDACEDVKDAAGADDTDC